jgi:probable HAF family extracellular repeat protein
LFGKFLTFRDVFASAVIVLCTLPPAPGYGQTTRYTVTELGSMFVGAINDNGQFAGVRVGSPDRPATISIWEDGHERELVAQPVHCLGIRCLPKFFVSAVNNKGQIVVGILPDRGDPEHALVWDNGKLIDLGTLGGQRSAARAVNDRGQVVGWSETSGGGTSHAFLWSDGEMKDLGTLPGFDFSNAASINNQGQIVGELSNTAKRQISHAFLWEGGKMQDLGLLPNGKASDWFEVKKINNRGQIVGTELGGPGRGGFLWEAGRMRSFCGAGSINPALTSCQLADVNDQGQIIGLAVKEAGGSLTSYPFVSVNGSTLNLNEAIPDSGRKLSNLPISIRPVRQA